MAEVITETILPGTYIEVRSEGLLTVGAFATGNVGVLGTAEKGSEQIAILSSLEEGRARFGQRGDWDPSPAAADANLTLVRALELLFANGARTVYARRVLDPTSAKTAVFPVVNSTNTPVLTLRARSPGTWGNRLQIRVEDADAQELIADERVARVNGNGAMTLSAAKLYTPAPAGSPVGTLTVRANGLIRKYAIKEGSAAADEVQVNLSSRTLNLAPPPAPAADLRASYWVAKESLRKVTLRFENIQEVYLVPSVMYLAQQITDPTNPSRLVEVDPSGTNPIGPGLPRTTGSFQAFSGGENGPASRDQYLAALEELVDQDIQILTLAGPSFSQIKAAVLGHLEKTENLGRERIAVLGADGSADTKVLENANAVADKRLVLVAPGLKLNPLDPATGRAVTLPPSFAAAAVAGLISALAPHVSPTNKTLAGIDDLAVDYNDGQLKSLVQNRVLALQQKRGVRVVKGITTDDQAFRQITLRRIVDFGKRGTRQGADQYIGRLNNRRVRENLRTTLDSFLADLVIREFLTGYNLTVTADRAMEIRGEVLVMMDLNPTFSVDVIRVIMNLS